MLHWQSLRRHCILCQRAAFYAARDGKLFATLQPEASRMTLKLSEDPKKSKLVQLIEVAEKMWKSTKYKPKAPEEKYKFPKL